MRPNNPPNPQKKGNPLMMKLGNIGNSTLPKPPSMEFTPTKTSFTQIDAQPNNQRTPSQATPQISQTQYNSQPQRGEVNSQFRPRSHNGSANPLLNFGQMAEGGGVIFNQTKQSKIGSAEFNTEEFNKASYTYTPLSSPTFVLGNNVWENYKNLTQEIKRTDCKINELNSIIRQFKMSSDPNEIRPLQNAVYATKNELQRVSAENANLEREKERLVVETKSTDMAVDQKKAEIERMKTLMKSPAELNGLLGSVKQQLQTVQDAKHKMDYEAKIQLDKESRETMERKLYEICMESAKSNQDPKVQELYQKLLAANSGIK